MITFVISNIFGGIYLMYVGFYFAETASVAYEQEDSKDMDAKAYRREMQKMIACKIYHKI